MEETLFQTSNPEMMDPIRLLIVDHDVLRYHSFDLVRYTLRECVKSHDVDTFKSLQPNFQFLVNRKHTENEQIRLMRNRMESFYALDCFDVLKDKITLKEYEAWMRSMFASDDELITPTDIGRNFDVVFARSNVWGFLLRYKGDSYQPDFGARVKSIEVGSVLDLNLACEQILINRINGVLVANAQFCIELALKCVAAGIKWKIDFMVGRYAYNFVVEDGKTIMPKYNEEFKNLELKYGFSFGYFDPITRLSSPLYQNAIKEETNYVY